jgi:hypothetical protein
MEADLSETNVRPPQLEETMGDENTNLPSRLTPPTRWGVKTDEQIAED